MEYFSMIAKWLSGKAAQPMACFLAFFIILVWALSGFSFHFSEIWQLIINTFAAVVSIVMLFIIQNSQNRHTIAIQLKLDEIIRATKGAHNEMMDIEKLTDEDLARIQKKYGLLAEKTKEDLKKGKQDTHTPDIGNIITKGPQALQVFIFGACFLWTASAWGMEIYLKNGDKISGVVVGEDTNSMLVQTLAAGEIKIDRSFIDLPKTYPEQYEPPKITQQNPTTAAPAVVWKKDMALGYTQMGGNTKSQAGQFSTNINRKTPGNETTLKLDADYSSSNGVMNGKKFYGMLRYAYSFGNNLKWYNFYKMEGDQDYFADIYYRLTPSTGVGYWFSDTDDLKAMTELGIGYQYTSYRIETTPSGGTPVLVPRFFVDKRLIGNLHLSEDLTIYPSLDNFNNYRFRSETDLINQITKAWSLKISYVDDFNSDPPPMFKKQDYTWVSSLEYHF